MAQESITPDQRLNDALSALADMWNQYCPPPMGHAYTSTGEYAEDVLTAAGLMGADGVAAFPAQPPAPRPLSSLTDEEAKECYRLAFGKDREPDRIQRGGDEQASTVTIAYYTQELYIDSAGMMSANHEVDGALWTIYEADEFNAVAVVRYLDSIGIALGADGA